MVRYFLFKSYERVTESITLFGKITPMNITETLGSKTGQNKKNTQYSNIHISNGKYILLKGK